MLVGKAPERTFAGLAHRATPTFRKVDEGHSRRNLAPLVAPIRVIDKSAIGHLAAPHVFRLGHISSLWRSPRLPEAPWPAAINPDSLASPAPARLHGALRTTRIAQAVKFKTGRGDGKARQNKAARVRYRYGEHGIGHFAAFQAAHMLMRVKVAVKAPAAAGRFDLENRALFGKQIEVAVDSAQTDARQAPAHHIIQLVRRGMRDYFAQLFKYNCTLPRYAL